MAPAAVAEHETPVAAPTAPEPGPERAWQDKEHYEVVNGIRVETPWMGAKQNRIATHLSFVVHAFVLTGRVGKVIHETLFRVDKQSDLQYRPDLAFVSTARWPGPVPDANVWDVVPDLAVEIVSRTNTAYEVKEKVRNYFRCGVRLVWVLYPDQRLLEVYRSLTGVRILTDGDTLDGGEVLPGFSTAVAAVFDEA